MVLGSKLKSWFVTMVLKFFKVIVINHNFNFKPKTIVSDYNFNFFKKFKVIVTNYDFDYMIKKRTNLVIVLKH